MTYDKEAVYDAQIAPLMKQILEITRQHGIQMLASFALMDQDPNYNDESMVCTSYTEGDTWNEQTLRDARAVVLGQKKAVSGLTYALIMTTP